MWRVSRFGLLVGIPATGSNLLDDRDRQGVLALAESTERGHRRRVGAQVDEKHGAENRGVEHGLDRHGTIGLGRKARPGSSDGALVSVLLGQLRLDARLNGRVDLVEKIPARRSGIAQQILDIAKRPAHAVGVPVAAAAI